MASAEQGGRRLIIVLNGMTSKRARAAEARKVMNYGFRSFTSEVLVESGDVVTELPVWHGRKGNVSLVPDRLFKVIVPRGGAPYGGHCNMKSRCLRRLKRVISWGFEDYSAGLLPRNAIGCRRRRCARRHDIPRL